MATVYNESQEAVLNSRNNFCVIAGAGSGKTGTIVEYIVRFIEDDLDNNSITQVLALTFSEKAAAEMNERVSKAFRDRLKAARQAGQATLATKWEREFRRLGQAQIGTIHSYAFTLVKNYAHLLGLPMNLEVDTSETQTRDMVEVIKDLLNDNNPDLSFLIRLMPLKSDFGPSIYRWLSSTVTRLTSWGLKGLISGVAPPKDDAKALFQELAAAIMSASEYVESTAFETKKYPNVLIGVRGLVSVLENLKNVKLKILDDTPLLADNLPITYLPRFLFEIEPYINLLSSWRKKQNHNHKAEISAPFAALRSYLASVEAAPVTEALVRIANQMPDLIRARCRVRRQISFDDILTQARNLLKTNKQIRSVEAAKWRLIIVDEFQDTNRLQADLIAQIIPESGHGFNFQDLDWSNLPSKLRVVGDPKQSIYLFRGSEPSIMANLTKAMPKGQGQVLNLDTNYRSQAPLIDFFNALFPKVLTENYEHQLSKRQALYTAKPVTWLTEEAAPSTRIPAETQATLVVAYLADLFSGKAGIMVADKSRGGAPESDPRLPTPGDVAILLRRRKNADVFQAAISAADWPCHTLKGMDLFDMPEIAGLTSAYLYLCGRSEDLNLATALTSPLGPISEATLTRLAWPETPNPVKRAISWYFEDEGRLWPSGISFFELDALIRLRRLFLSLKPYVLRRPPGEIIEAMVEERYLMPLLVSGEYGSPDRVKNIQYFVEHVKTIPLSDHYHPESAADIMENLLVSGLNKGDSGGEAFAGLPDEGSINIMTVHRSKGLEFPIVIVPEADVGLPKNTTGIKICDQGKIVVRFRSETLGTKLEPPEFAIFKEIEASVEHAENMRLFYVAATRARDHLVFVGHKEKPVVSSWLRAIKDFENYTDHVQFATPDISEEITRAEPAVVFRQPQSPQASDLGIMDRYNPAMIKPAPVADFIQLSVTIYCQIFVAFKNGATNFEEATRIAWNKKTSEESPLHVSVGPKEGPTSPALRGTIFHSVMETSSFDLDIVGYKSLVGEKAAWHGAVPSVEEIDYLAFQALRFQMSEYGQELKKTMDAGRLYRREWPFWLSLEKDENNFGPIQLSGVVDLFYVNEEGHGRLIDFKLAKQSSNLAYEKQLEIYSMAIKMAGFTGELVSSIWYSGS